MGHPSVFIVRSDEVGWIALQAALPTVADVSLAGEATSIPEAERSLALLPYEPNLILSAAHLGDASVVPLLQHLRCGACPTSRFVIFASSFQADELLAFSEVGKVSCLLWSDLCCLTLPHCLATLIAANVIISSQAVVSCFIEALQNPLRALESNVRLTEREEKILTRLGEGLTCDQIAQAEGLSLRTINRIVSILEEKLDAPSLFVLGSRAVLYKSVRPQRTDQTSERV